MPLLLFFHAFSTLAIRRVLHMLTDSCRFRYAMPDAPPAVHTRDAAATIFITP